MKFVEINKKTGVVSWDGYFDYLKRNMHAFPDPMYEYVSDWGHYSLDGENSLHDAWIDSVRFLRSGPDLNSIEVVLLGARHDRLHRLIYGGIHKFDYSGFDSMEAGAHDLIVHEFIVDGLTYTHEMRFGESGRLFVKFDEFRHQVDNIAST